jgi:hypothetical protein
MGPLAECHHIIKVRPAQLHGGLEVIVVVAAVITEVGNPCFTYYENRILMN